jgi:soluble lytic murein transglycosylase-like protein
VVDRRRRPPWERRRPYPRHPLGRARRRWPRAFDGGHDPRPPALRYRSGALRERGAAPGRRKALQRLRETPVRSGLIGLAIAGTAAPIGVNRYQQALRTDPAHERVATNPDAGQRLDDHVVMERWRAMLAAEAERARAEAEAEAVGERDLAIEQKLERYGDYALSRAMAEDIYDAAVEAGVDPELAFGLVKAESSFSNRATSPVGAIGLTQLMPRTAAWMEPGTTTRDLRDQRTNLRVGFKYLSYLIDKYRGNENLALLAYNRGPGTVDRVLRQGGNPANGYVEMVRERAR